MRALLFSLAVAVPLLLLSADVLGHGGSHPTPGPPPGTPRTPTPTPPPGTPTPTPTPTPFPTPKGTPSPKGTPGPTTTPTTANVPWSGWWWANQWRFLRVKSRMQVESGTGGEKDRAYEEITRFLGKALRNKYYDVRSAAALALGKARAEGHAKAVAALLGSKHEEVRESALLALGMLGFKPAIPAMVGILEDKRQPQSVRVNAAVGLGILGDTGAGDDLLGILGTEPTDANGMTVEIRAAACLALGLMKCEKAVAPLVRLIRDSEGDPRLRAVAVTALGKFRASTLRLEAGEVSASGTILEAMSGSNPYQVRRAAIMSLADVWYEGLGTNLFDLHRNDPDGWMRCLSLLVLAEKVEDPGLEKAFHKRLKELLTGERVESRSLVNFAALAAGLSGYREAAGPLRTLFQESKKEETRAAAAVGLGFLKDTDAIPLLLEGLRGSSSPWLKSFCCVSFALMGKGDRRVSAELRAILTDPKCLGHLRSSACIALAKIGDASAVNLLYRFLEKGGDRTLRQLLVISTGYFRDYGSFLPLRKVYDSRNTAYETRALVCVALGYIVEKEHPPVLKRIFKHYNYLLTFPNLHRIFRMM
jgi:HEAT repeat protein